MPREPELPKMAELPKQPAPQPEPEPELEPEQPIPAPVQYTTQQEEPQIQPSTLVSQQPDVIPLQRESIQSDIYETVAPPAAFGGNENGVAVESVPEIVQSVPAEAIDEQIYSNINYIQQQAEGQAQPENDLINPTVLAGNEDCNLSEYIEDTKIQAIALYDYQASADDEISFDPNDIITHIEKVSNCTSNQLINSVISIISLLE